MMPHQPTILPVFLPHLGCRQRCLFCNQGAVAQVCPTPEGVGDWLERALAGIPIGRRERVTQVAFYGGSFTAIPEGRQEIYLQALQPFIRSGRIDSIRISTRPDCLGEGNLALLRHYGVRTVEIGAQSMIDEVLLLSRRGHRAEETCTAVFRLREWGFEAGLHLMTGLPGDRLDLFLRSLDRVIRLRPDFVRIHPTLVLKGAPLEGLWDNGAYRPQSLDETLAWLKKGLLRLEEASLPVARVGLQPDPVMERHVVAGPYHPALHQLVDSAIAYEMAARLLQGNPAGGEATFACNPREVSNLRGQRNRNISELKTRFKLEGIAVQVRGDVARDRLILHTRTGTAEIRRRDLIS